VAGEITTSRDVALEMHDLFERLGDPNLKMIGNWALGAALFHLGELEVAHDHLRRALDLYDPAFHRPRVWETGIEPGIFCRSEYSRTLTLLGYPDQALTEIRQAVAEARALDHPQPLAFALLFEIFVHLARRSPRDVQRTYDQLAAVCHAHGIAQEVQWAAPLCGRAYIELGDAPRGLRVLEEGLAAHAITRSALLRPYFLVLLAGALLRTGQFDRAQRALDDAARIEQETEQHAYTAEHGRLQAELFAARGDAVQAERMYRHALATAERQGSKWLELRAARGFAHFLLGQERQDEARALLSAVLPTIVEGHGTLDYHLAESLLETLAEPS
jgi:tetratricopeptide (TPR) repeat protein